MTKASTAETLSARTASWLQSIAGVNEHQMVLDFNAAALLVIDMQRFFLDLEAPSFMPAGLAVVPNVARLIDAFRTRNRPVIYTRHVHHPAGLDAGILGWWWDEACIEGSAASEIIPELAPLPTEKVVLKHRYSAFFNTDLDTVLRCLEIRDIVICGVMTNMCCESTARDAYFRDYRVFFLADATAAVSDEMHLASLLNLAYGFAWVTSTDQLLAAPLEHRTV